MARYHVFGVGNALVDMEFHVTDEALEELKMEKGVMTLIDEIRHNSLTDKLMAFSHKRSCGGSAANTVISVSQLGGDAFYSCKVASDELGNFYIQDLNDCGVNCGTLSNRLEQGTTGKCIAMVTPDADRTLNTFLGITSNIGPTDVNKEAIADSDYVYIEGYLVTGKSSHDAALTAVNTAREAGVQTALTLSDPNMVKLFKNELLQIANNKLDLLFCNEQEAQLLAGADDITGCFEPLKNISKKIIITKGPDGATIYDGKNIIDILANKVEATDTNGAGDMFAGAYLYGITQGMDCTTSGDLASFMSSQLVTEFGPRLTVKKSREYLKLFNSK